LAYGFATRVKATVASTSFVTTPSAEQVAGDLSTPVNEQFKIDAGWSAKGDVAFGAGAITLKETATAQTRLNQVFVLGENDRFLSFTLAGIALDDAENAPDDTFEVALIDATTGLSLLKGSGLTRSDAFLNLQAEGSEYKASGVTTIRNADGSRRVLVDLSGIAAGTVVNLSYDLIGFGRGAAATSSQVTVRDLRLGMPQEARDDVVATAEDTPLDIDVIANDLGADQVGVQPLVVTGPAHGTLELTTEGRLRYVPATNWSGEDSFTYRLSDGRLESNLATVTLTVTPVNDAPVATDARFTLEEDSTLALDLLALASDVEGDALKVEILSGPQHGQLELNADGRFTYTPDANWNGTDGFTYRVSDGSLVSAPASVSLNVTPVNDAPVTGDARFTLEEDGTLALDLLALASDFEGDALKVEILSGPQHGQLSLNADGRFTYTPDANWNGTDGFTYRVTDGSLASAPASVTLNVTPVNDAPVATDARFTLEEDGTLALDLLALASDFEGDALKVEILSGPQHGQLALNADGRFTYTPDANWNGTDGFTYRVSDGSLTSAPASVNLNVTPVNDAPVTADARFTLEEDSTLALDLLALASDIEGDALSVEILSGPQHGQLSLNADGRFTYTPDANWNGIDGFTYRVTDGSLASAPASVTLNVIPVNDAPQVTDRDMVLNEDATLTLDLLQGARDVEGDALAIQVLNGPRHGRLELGADGSFLYIPEANFHGEDRFTYRANDGQADSAVAEVRIVVVPVNDAPVVSPLAATLLEDGRLVLDLLAQAQDVDGDPLTLSVLQPGHGQLTRNADGTWTYTPAADYHGDDAFTFEVNDGQVSVAGVVRLTITAVNDAPVALDDYATLNEDASIILWPMSNDRDVEGDRLQLQLLEGPAHGRLVRNADGSLTYTPVADWSGEDRFTYRLSDGQAESGVATVRLVVTPVADAPSLVLSDPQPQSREVFRTSWESVADFSVTSTLVKARELEGWTLITRPDSSWGGNNGFEIWSTSDKMMDARYRLRPVSAMAGNGDNWLELNNAAAVMHQTLGIERSVQTVAGARYTLSLDLAGRMGYGADYTRIGIYVDGVRIGGDASTSDLQGLEWRERSVQFTGTGGKQTIRIISEAERSSVNGRGMMVDDILLTETLPANVGQENSLIRLSVIGASLKDTDGSESLALRIEAVPVGAVLTDGVRSFTAREGTTTADVTGWQLDRLGIRPPQDFTGSFVLKVVAAATERSNQARAVTMADIEVKVISFNTAPIAQDASFTLLRNGWVRIDFAALVRDAEGDALQLTLGKPAHGILVRDHDGSYLYRPHAGYSGTDSFSYAVSDGRKTTRASIGLTVMPSSCMLSGATLRLQSSLSCQPAASQSDRYLILRQSNGERPRIDWDTTPSGLDACDLSATWLPPLGQRQQDDNGNLGDITGLVFPTGRQGR